MADRPVVDASGICSGVMDAGVMNVCECAYVCVQVVSKDKALQSIGRTAIRLAYWKAFLWAFDKALLLMQHYAYITHCNKRTLCSHLNTIAQLMLLIPPCLYSLSTMPYSNNGLNHASVHPQTCLCSLSTMPCSNNGLNHAFVHPQTCLCSLSTMPCSNNGLNHASVHPRPCLAPRVRMCESDDTPLVLLIPTMPYPPTPSTT